VSYFFLFLFLSINSLAADSVPTIAVASNFNHAMDSLVNLFEKERGHKIRVSYGATGSLYSQIVRGAPFDAFFAADKRTIELLIKENIAIGSSQFIYAVGSLVFICDKCSKPLDWNRSIRDSSSMISIANPELAPYGRATSEVLETQKIKGISKRIVYGSSVGQAYQFIRTKNMSLGFVSESLVIADKVRKDSFQIISKSLYSPILQSAAILKKGTGEPVVQKFFKFLKSSKAIEIIKSSGYSEFKNVQ
jgi:molybdate transport system substrate-binding protein